MTDRLAVLQSELLVRVGECRELSFRLPESSRELQFVQPVDFDALLDAAAGDPEQNLPYWAEIWPSGIALADELLAQSELVRGKRVLEIGSGIGVTASIALSVGTDLTVADYSPESLLLCRYNALRNSGHEPNALQINWRDPAAELRTLAGSGFPAVLAADVLYESRDIAPLLELIDWLVAPDGLLWLAEPGRNVAARFIEQATDRGWSDTLSFHAGPWPDPRDANVAVTVHQLRRGKDE
jgi:predicted nicotinamide N-methyase